MNTIETAPQSTGAGTGRPAGLAGLMSLQAWVWTASVLPKLTSGAFLSGFARFVGSAPPTRSALYGHLVTPIVLAAPSVFALGALATEMVLAVTFVVTAVVLLRRRPVPRRLLVAGSVASLVAAGFALNLALLVGDAAPWRLGDPFDSGVPVEYLLAGLGVVTAVSAMAVLRTTARRPRLAPAARSDHDTPMRSGREPARRMANL